MKLCRKVSKSFYERLCRELLLESLWKWLNVVWRNSDVYLYREYDTSWSIKMQWFGRGVIMKRCVYISEFSKTNIGKSIYQKGQSISLCSNVKKFAKLHLVNRFTYRGKSIYPLDTQKKY